jgi:hypothetical protein
MQVLCLCKYNGYVYWQYFELQEGMNFTSNGGIPILSTNSMDQFLATDPEARVRFPAPPEKKIVSLERGPLSLVSTTEELLDRKVSAPV